MAVDESLFLIRVEIMSTSIFMLTRPLRDRNASVASYLYPYYCNATKCRTGKVLIRGAIVQSNTQSHLINRRTAYEHRDICRSLDPSKF